MVVQHNMSAINANRYFGMNNNKLSKSLEKLSSGYAINRAGDNAAGLAVSEKMRAQISGLTQASKNAQDGISMTQTFEGALTETDAILQRMRSLAVQSSNGSYDDSVDRAAIQLEYDQLNDELNQIADTDFNGVVVLNGGEMADGLKANADGKFDYAEKDDQVIKTATDALKAVRDKAVTDFDAKIATAQTAKDAAEDAIATTNYDLSSNGTATEWNTLDNSTYDKAAADELWKELKLLEDPDQAFNAATNPVSTDTVNKVTVTFKFDGTDWVADKATGNDGSDLDETVFDTTTAAVADASGNGGFSVATKTGGTTIGNAVFNATDAKSGDTVTLTFSNAQPVTYAPTNIGFDESTVKVTSTGVDPVSAPTVTLSGVKDSEMTAAIDQGYKDLEGLKFTTTYDGSGTEPSAVTLGGTALAGDNLTTTGDIITIGTKKFWIEADNNATPTTFTISTLDGAGTAKGTELAEIGITAGVATAGGPPPTAGTIGSVEGVISISASAFQAQPPFTASVGDDTTLGTSNEAKDALAKANSDLTTAQNAKTDELAKIDADITKASTFEGAKAYLAETGVSISDSNDSSTAKLSYTNNITLQVGARTKDSVNFTFQYESDGIGDLKDDLNCTAKGLGTDKVSLATQKDANAAIDKIDNAINKVSMVRGTFGALQNRLEHKIDNLNTTNENLTAAESRIRDTDMATEMMNFTKNQILSQASQAMLAQANTLPQGVLSLLQ